MTMRGAFFAALMLASAVAGSADIARADAIPSNSAELEKQVAKHDPKAVAAARHYYQTPAIKAGIVAVLQNVTKSMLALVAQQNPSLTPQQLADVGEVVQQAMTDRLDMLLEMNMVAALDIFSTDELIAMDNFYSSPQGVSILSKMPQLAGQMPSMMKAFMPDYLADVKAKMKAKGTELKL